MIKVTDLKKVAVNAWGAGTLLAKQNAPLALTTVGIVGLVTAGVLASRATLKLEDTVENINDHKEMAKNRLEDGRSDVKTYQKDMVRVYLYGVRDLGKLYGPALTLGAVSIVSIASAHNMLSKRNMALAAAYKAIEHSYNEYRKRVVEEFGIDKDQDFRLGLRQEKVKDETTGKTKTVTTMDTNALSPYAKFFDEFNINWESAPQYNEMFLQGQQTMMNDRLQQLGHVFLNDVYKRLGFEETEAGAVVGWHRDHGIGFIDFGMFDPENEKAREFLQGVEKGIWLDFNVDGIISHHLPKY